MSELSVENQTSIAEALLQDSAIDTHPVMKKLRGGARNIYDEILRLAASKLTVEEITSNGLAQNEWLLRSLHGLRVELVLEFFRYGLNKESSEVVSLAMRHLYEMSHSTVAKNAKSIRALVQMSQRSLLISGDVEQQALELLMQTRIAVKTSFI